MKTPVQSFRRAFTSFFWSAMLVLPCFTCLSQTTNQVLALNGSSDFVSIPSAPELQNPSEITVEAWIYPAPLGHKMFFINKGDSGFADSPRSYELTWESGVIVFSVFLGPSTWAGAGVAAQPEQWVHIAGTYSSLDSLLRIYKNGLLIASISTDAGGVTLLNHQLLRQTSLPLVFGAELTHPMGFAGGKMDEVRIWNKARTPADILHDYARKLPGTTPGLVGHWTFDDMTANDQSGGGHNGSFGGNAHAEPIIGTDVVHAGGGGVTIPPRAATVSGVVMNGFIIGGTITDGGYGYSNTPNVRIFGGGGSGAKAVAVVSNGVVVAVNFADAGHGYTNTPILVIDPPFLPNPNLDIAPMSFLSFSNLAIGGVYRLQRFEAWYWVNEPINFTAASSTYTQMVSGVVSTKDYQLTLNPVPNQAFATAQIINGFLIGAQITSGGSGYLISPAVTISGGGGTNATAVSHISDGVVTGISITSAGIGYTNSPTIQIARPPAASLAPKVASVMRIDSTNLAPYDNYQIQFKPRLDAPWNDWIGGLFCPTGKTSSQHIFVTNGMGMFQVKHLP